MDADPNITEVVPIPNPPPQDGAGKLNELLSVLTLMAFLWSFFK